MRSRSIALAFLLPFCVLLLGEGLRAEFEPALQVLPARVRVQPGDFVAFTAIARNAEGAAYTPDGVSWSASDGRMGEDGVLEAGDEPGVLRVTAQWQGKSFETVVHVVNPMIRQQANEDVATGPNFIPEAQEGEVVRLEIVPRSARVRWGETIAFDTRGFDLNRHPAECPIEWETNGGQIDKDGSFTANGPIGRWQVTARNPENRVMAQAWVRVLPPRPTPLPGLVAAGAIHVKVWETGASTDDPRCKIIATVSGEGARRLALFGITDRGRIRRLARVDAPDGHTVAFAANYRRYVYDFLELRLYDARGRLQARHRRRISR